MNRLKHTRGYLCGAMDRVADAGEGWRVALQEHLRDLGVFWLDPTHKPIPLGIEDDAIRARINMLKQQGRFDELPEALSIIRAVDLRMVDISDFLVVNLDLEVHATGTYEELFLANRQKKPIIIHVEQGKSNTPNWLFGAVPHQMIFSTWAEVVSYLLSIDSDPVVETYDRWRFFDFELCRKFEDTNAL